MSAPKTNIEKQKRRHIGPLLGIAVSVIVAALLLLWLLGNVLVEDPVATESDSPAEVPDAVIDPVSPDESPVIDTPEPVPGD